MKKERYNYLHIEATLSKLAERVSKLDETRYVTGVPRGGLIPAVIFSHKYEIPYIELNEAKNLPTKQRNTILAIDDICDSGETLMDPDKLGFQTSALYLKKSSKFYPTFHGENAEEDIWIVFPWEKYGAPAIQNYLIKE